MNGHAEGCKCQNKTAGRSRYRCQSCNHDYCGPCYDAKVKALAPMPPIPPGKDLLIRNETVFNAALNDFQSGKVSADEFYSDLFDAHAPSLKPKDDKEIWKLLKLIFSTIPDPERRAAIQLRHWNVRPRFDTLCCSSESCFKCKTKGWHTGKSCSENISKLDSSSMPCPNPGCGVMLTKSDGCDSVTCVCAHKFAWTTAMELYKHVKKFIEKYPENTATKCAEILCGFLTDLSKEALIQEQVDAGHYRKHNMSLVDKVVVKSWKNRFQSGSHQILAKVLLDPAFRSEFRVHSSVLATIIKDTAIKSKADAAIVQILKSEKAALDAIYPRPLDKYLAFDYMNKLKSTGKLTKEELDTFNSLQKYKKFRLLEFSKAQEEAICNSAFQFLAISGNDDVKTIYKTSNNGESEDQVHTWDAKWSNKLLELDEEEATVRRPGKVSRAPAAFSLMREGLSIDTFQIRIVNFHGDQVGSESNYFSFGVCRYDENDGPELLKSGEGTSNTNLFGCTKDTYGVIENRNGGDSSTCNAHNGSGSHSKQLKKLAVDDKLTATIDLEEMKCIITINDNPAWSYTYPLPVTSGDSRYCFGVTMAYENTVEILDDGPMSERKSKLPRLLPYRTSTDGIPNYSISSSTKGLKEGNVRGALLKKEKEGMVENLGGTGTEDWNKWFHPGVASSWAQLDFTKPDNKKKTRHIQSYGICSANDLPERDPKKFEFQRRNDKNGMWETLHKVEACPFNKRWQWVWYPLERPVEASTVRLLINSNKSESKLHGVQLGHFHVKYIEVEEDVSASSSATSEMKPDKLTKLVTVEQKKSFSNFLKLLKCIDSLETATDERVQQSLRIQLERRAEVGESAGISKEQCKVLVKKHTENGRAKYLTSDPVVEGVSWNRLFDTSCNSLIKGANYEVEDLTTLGWQFLQDHGEESAGMMAAFFLHPNQSVPNPTKEQVKGAKALISFMPDLLDDYYKANAKLPASDSLIPDLLKVDKRCFCLPRCAPNTSCDALSKKSSTSSSKTAGGGGGKAIDDNDDDEFDLSLLFRFGCDGNCTCGDHTRDGNCLVCGRPWGNHSGHNCREGERGSWLSGGNIQGRIPSKSQSSVAGKLMFR